MSNNRLRVAAFVASVLVSAPAFAQQAGGIRGKVTVEAAGATPAGITVTAESAVMPRPRSATVKADGSYALPLLLPGKYTLTFSNAQGVLQKVDIEVLLDQTSVADVAIAATRPDELQLVRIVASTGLTREGNASLANSLGSKTIDRLPVGQQYRDLLKLIPGVQYSENSVLGPSAGGSGVDNKYGFDGIDVSLPLFGNLAADPSTQDVENVSMERGGAKAVGFNRSGGFAINTTSKSGTNEFKGTVEYKVQPKGMVSKIRGTSKYLLDQSWVNAGFGGPIVEDSLFFYASYYRPEVTRDNPTTAYGPVKNYESIRNEYFGKLTWAPTDALLFNLSLRTSDREANGASIGTLSTDTVSLGEASKQDILTLEGSWILSDATTLSTRLAKFELQTASVPDTVLGFTGKPGDRLSISSLATQGRFTVPTLRTAVPAGFTAAQLAAFNVGAQSLIAQLGYTNAAGVKTGGGLVGAGLEFNDVDFYRDTVEIALDTKAELAGVSHDLHFGVKYSDIAEELLRTSNGWGTLTYAGGLARTTTLATPVPYFFQGSVYQAGATDATGKPLTPVINSSSKSVSLEVNDAFSIGNFDYNVGVLISEDVYYGQGLRRASGRISGWELAPGNRYEMYRVGWRDMIQPRLGVTWRYAGDATVFANFAQYNPEASSLARAASWDRNLFSRLVDMRFDQSGNFLEAAYRGSSSGKVFAEGLKPRRVDEITLGATKSLDNGLALRGHLRYRKQTHFWEDTPNGARLQTYAFNGVAGTGGAPADIRAKGLYVPYLAAIQSEIGGSSYVIAEMDGAYTRYYEASLEAEWQGERTFLSASYTWSQYRGNFDQDNTNSFTDANTFIGSSFYADGPGQYVWDNKVGTLSGDRPHIFKAYGYYTTSWKANIGAYLVAQSGKPWETWSSAFYGQGTGVDSIAAGSFAERAGSRRSPSHWQLDLNYTQEFKVASLPTLKFRADLFNVFDKQTGYNYGPFDYSTLYGQPRSFFLPRRVQLSVRVDF
jgi:hypothetical protein